VIYLNKDQWEERFDGFLVEALKRKAHSGPSPDVDAAWNRYVQQLLLKRKKQRKKRIVLLTAANLCMIFFIYVLYPAHSSMAFKNAFVFAQKWGEKMVTVFVRPNSSDNIAKTSPPPDMESGQNTQSGKGILREEVTTLQEARLKLDFKARTPNFLPVGYSIQRASVVYTNQEEKASQFRLTYSSSQGKLLSIFQVQLDSNTYVGRETEAGDHSMRVTVHGADLQYVEDKILITIYCEDISKEDVIKIAEFLN
jgi:hypothetical protein